MDHGASFAMALLVEPDDLYLDSLDGGSVTRIKICRGEKPVTMIQETVLERM